MTVTRQVFDDVRKDRDQWRARAKHAEARIRDLEVEVANTRRQASQIARQASQHRQIFGGWE